MRTGNYKSAKKKQTGIALLVLVIAITLAISAYYFSTISIEAIKADNLQKTRAALKSAKNSLIAYATLRSDLTSPSSQPARYGFLPCPANNNGDGNSVGTCGDKDKSAIGWFPWRSLGMEPLKDGNGDCLLYAVSSTYKYSPAASMLNTDTSFGMFQVVDENNNIIHGNTAQSRVVAIVFSAGEALAGQNRINNTGTECGGDADNFAAYLDTFEVAPGDVIDNSDVETLNTNRVDRFVKAASTANEGVFNDQLIAITREDIWPSAVAHRAPAFDISGLSGPSKVRRLTEALARCLASYANDNNNKSLPFPAPMDFAGNDYRENDNYADTSIAYVGRFPYTTIQADIVIPGTTSGDVMFEKNLAISCDDLTILLPPGTNVDLRSPGAEDRRVWNNWKDRIIYAVSERYAARAVPVDDSLPLPRCSNAAVSNNKCIRYNSTPYAAIIMYAGDRLIDVTPVPAPPPVLPQVREAPVAFEDSGVVTDTKHDINNYIEVIDPLGSGSGDGDFSPKIFSNDLFFCLTDTDPIDVVECI